MPKIVPHLWFDTQALEAARLYTSSFSDGQISNTSTMEGTPGQDTDMVIFKLAGQQFVAISAGPHFKLNPAISLMVYCATKEEVNEKWEALSQDGTILMPLDRYPFSKWYGWIQDQYGLSWQLVLAEEEKSEALIIPSLLFSQEHCGMAEDAMNYYVSLFPNSEVKHIRKYGLGEAKVSKAKVDFAAFTLANMNFVAMDNGLGGDFTFNQAFSLMVSCESQEEIDFYWHKLSAVPEAEQCGWLKDKYGVSWQIAYENFPELVVGSSPEARSRIMQAFLAMKKIDVDALERAGR